MRRIGLLAAVVLALAAPARGQEGVAAQPPVAPGETRAEALDRWFGVLDTTGDAEAAAVATTNIEELWLSSGSPTADLILSRAIAAKDAGDAALALDLLDGLLVLNPDFAEAWNQRANVRYQIGDLDGAVADAGRALGLEPRHYGAMAGLGQVFFELGELTLALTAFREALAMNPFMAPAASAVSRIERQLQADI